jgi:uncharacterized RDD family membrane protein YckC
VIDGTRDPRSVGRNPATGSRINSSGRPVDGYRVTTAGDYALAPLGRRAAAWLLDAGIGVVLASALVLATGGLGDLRTLAHLIGFKSAGGPTGHDLSLATNPFSPQPGALRPIAGLLVLATVIAVATVAYRVVTTAKWGAGLGKWLLGLRVVVDHADGPTAETPGWARSWRRWVVPQVPGLIPLPATGLLAYLPAFRDSRRRGLHDRAAGTIVVDLRSRPEPATGRTQRESTPTDDYYLVVNAPGS